MIKPQSSKAEPVGRVRKGPAGNGTAKGRGGQLDSSLLEAFLDAHGELGDAVALWDRKGLVHSNAALAVILGRPPAEVSAIPTMLSVVGPTDRTRLEARLRVRMHGAQRTDHGETTLLRADGKEVPVDYVVRGVSGADPDLQLWILHDISHERRLDSDLASSEQRFRSLGAAVADAILITSPDGTIRQSNDGAVRLFGKEETELIGSSSDRFFAKKDRALFLAAVKAGSEAAAGLGGEMVELDLQGPNDTLVPVEVHATRFGGAEGNRCLVMVRDISRRKATELDREKAIIELKQLNLAKTEFIHVAAHELKTPMAPIKAELALLKGSGAKELGNDQRRSVDTLVRNVERLSKFVEDLLEVSRMQAGRVPLKPEKVDLAAIVWDTVNLFEAAAKYGNLTIEVRGPEAFPWTADQTRVEQIIFNLVSNAIKFTTPGGRLSVEIRAEGDGALVEITDTGIGMRAEDIPTLFRPFATLATAKKANTKGTGLGLFICKTLVELHGGKIWCSSPGPGKGSTFGFSLPPTIPAVLAQEPPDAVQ